MGLSYIVLLIVSFEAFLSAESQNSECNCEEPMLYNVAVNQGKLESKVEMLEKELANIRKTSDLHHENGKETESANEATKTVAFNAYRTIPESYSNNQVIKFPHVALNEGNGYNADTGYFTAPVTGLYFFSAHVCHVGSKYVVFSIVHQDKKLAVSTVYENSTNAGSCSSISTAALVKKEDVVSVRSAHVTSSLLASSSYRWPSFTGVLIQSTGGGQE